MKEMNSPKGGDATPNGQDVDKVTDSNVEPEGVKTPDPERLLAESRKYKERAVKAERELAEAQKAKLRESENYKTLAESYQNENKQLKERMIKKAVQTSVGAAAAKAGCLSPEDAFKLGNRDLLVYDEESDEVHGADEFIEQLKKSKPFLFRTDVKGPAINPTIPGGMVAKKKLTAVEVARMPLQERIKILAQLQQQKQKG